MNTFRCDYCYRHKPKSEIHGNGCDDAEYFRPDTMWWCNSCDEGKSHEVRRVVINENGYTNYRYVSAFDTKEEAKDALSVLEEQNWEDEYILRKCY